MYENIYIYNILYVNDIFHDSTWKHLRQPCANLAPSLCFAGFPCVTPHKELVKSYKSVGCVPPRLKFLFRTFDRLSYIYICTHDYIYELRTKFIVRVKHGKMPSPNVAGALSVLQLLNMGCGVSVLGVPYWL